MNMMIMVIGLIMIISSNLVQTMNPSSYPLGHVPQLSPAFFSPSSFDGLKIDSPFSKIKKLFNFKRCIKICNELCLEIIMKKPSVTLLQCMSGCEKICADTHLHGMHTCSSIIECANVRASNLV